jgi:hypothetical protein
MINQAEHSLEEIDITETIDSEESEDMSGNNESRKRENPKRVDKSLFFIPKDKRREKHGKKFLFILKK